MATDNTFKEFNDRKTDTVIYSFNKLIPLLSNSNPNVIEMLGCNPEHYLHISDIGQELLNHKLQFTHSEDMQINS